MKLFITHTYKGSDNKTEIEELCRIVREAGWEDYSFVRNAENYSKTAFSSPQLMMTAAKKAICDSDALLIDITDPSLGKGIEAGIAYQAGKKIIVLLKKGAEARRTAYGIADLVIEYGQISDIRPGLSTFLQKLI